MPNPARVQAEHKAARESPETTWNFLYTPSVQRKEEDFLERAQERTHRGLDLRMTTFQVKETLAAMEGGIVELFRHRY